MFQFSVSLVVFSTILVVFCVLYATSWDLPSLKMLSFRAKKRETITFCFWSSAVFTFIAAFVPSNSYLAKMVVTAMVILARLMAVGVMNFLIPFVVELYPTAIRSTGTRFVMGMCRLPLAVLPIILLFHQVRFRVYIFLCLYFLAHFF